MVLFFPGIRQHETNQKFHKIISEVGSSLLLVAAFGLLIPSAFYSALKSETVKTESEKFTPEKLDNDILKISQMTSIVLIIAYGIYLIYSCTSAHSVFDEVIEQDEHGDLDHAEDMKKPKLTMTEALLAIGISIALVIVLLVMLVDQIEHVVEAGVPDQFLGLILLPLVEKAAEHLTAIDEAYDGVMNVALYHCLGPSIQTALFNAPLVVLVGWVMNKPMDLNFEIFMIVLLVLSILVVGNFLRDQESNWLEGSLLVVSRSNFVWSLDNVITDRCCRSSTWSSRSHPSITQILTWRRPTDWEVTSRNEHHPHKRMTGPLILTSTTVVSAKPH